MMAHMLFGFGAEPVDAYGAETPVLDLRDFLRGPLSAAGVFVGLSGRVRRRFVVEMNGTWSGNRGMLEEHFRFADGETGDRVWTMHFADDRAFTATAPDVEGVAEGLQCGNAASMRYRLRLPRVKGEIVVGMQDWFHLMEDGTLINRTRMTKFGFKVGELVVSFRKRVVGETVSREAGPP